VSNQKWKLKTLRCKLETRVTQPKKEKGKNLLCSHGKRAFVQYVFCYSLVELCNCISKDCKGDARRVAGKADRTKAIQMFSVLRDIGFEPSDELWLCSYHSGLVGVTTASKGGSFGSCRALISS
jgi:hypothetical protein